MLPARFGKQEVCFTSSGLLMSLMDPGGGVFYWAAEPLCTSEPPNASGSVSARSRSLLKLSLWTSLLCYVAAGTNWMNFP